jgi:hypothetical protein
MRETHEMLIHELTNAVQQDRERAMRQALATRRHLAMACLAAPRGLLDRLRSIGQPTTPATPRPARPSPVDATRG